MTEDLGSVAGFVIAFAGGALTVFRRSRHTSASLIVGTIPNLWNGTTIGWAVLLLLASVADRVLDPAEQRLARHFAGPRTEL